MVDNSIDIQAIRHQAEVFKALGHPARLTIVQALEDGERCVCELVELVGTGFSTVSRHLSILKAAGVIEDEKRGQFIYYRLVLPCVMQFCNCLKGR